MEQMHATEDEETKNEIALRLIRCQGLLILKLIAKHGTPPGVVKEDVCAELVAILLQAIDKFNPQTAQLSTYVYTIVYRRLPRVIGFLAPDSREHNADMAFVESHPVDSEDCESEAAEAIVAIDGIWNLLEEAQQEILSLRASGMSYAQTARSLMRRYKGLKITAQQAEEFEKEAISWLKMYVQRQASCTIR